MARRAKPIVRARSPCADSIHREMRSGVFMRERYADVRPYDAVRIRIDRALLPHLGHAALVAVEALAHPVGGVRFGHLRIIASAGTYA
jgi:hypothetical protein